jgi:signal transduction histidine kinase
MLRRIQSQLIALATYVVVSVSIVLEIGEALPHWALVAALFSSCAFVIFWVVVLGREQFRQPRALPSAKVLRHQSAAFMWTGNIASVLGFWLTMPYADSSLRMMNVIFGTSTVAFEMLGTIQRAPQSGRSSLAPLCLSVSIICYFAVFWERFSPLIIFFTIAATYVFWMMRQIAQGAINRSFLAKQEAENARDSKSRFLASASHDLGQPLQSARLFFDQVVRGADPARRAKAAGQAEAAFAVIERQLHKMIEHLKLDSGDVTPRLTDVAVGPLIARLASLAEAQAAEAGVAIHALPSRLVVHADADLLERALSNFIDNAIHHSKGRRVLIGVRVSSPLPQGERESYTVRLWVIDDGRGVAAQDQARLFDDYAQGSDHGDEVRGGFGLGLASVRRIMALMGGRCGLDPRWRGGAAFFLELPETLRQT